MKSKNKKIILECMKTLIRDGEQLAAGNEGDFSEFAEDNGFDLAVVNEVYGEHEDELNELYNEIHK
jgi:hypothetical protein